MCDSPATTLARVAVRLQEVTGLAVTDLAHRIGWKRSQSSLLRFLAGDEGIRLNQAVPLVAGLAQEFQIGADDIWPAVINDKGKGEPHMLITALAEGRVWHTTPDTAEYWAERLAGMAQHAAQVRMISSHFPLFLMPKLVIPEILMGLLNSVHCHRPQVLKAQKTLTCSFQGMLELAGATGPTWTIILREEQIRAIRDHAAPFETLKSRDVKEIRLELTRNWVPRGFLFAALPTSSGRHLECLLRCYRWLLVFDNHALVGQPIPGFNPVCCEATNDICHRCIARHAEAMTDLLKCVPYTLTAGEVVRVLDKLLG